MLGLAADATDADYVAAEEVRNAKSPALQRQRRQQLQVQVQRQHSSSMSSKGHHHRQQQPATRGCECHLVCC